MIDALHNLDPAGAEDGVRYLIREERGAWVPTAADLATMMAPPRAKRGDARRARADVIASHVEAILTAAGYRPTVGPIHPDDGRPIADQATVARITRRVRAVLARETRRERETQRCRALDAARAQARAAQDLERALRAAGDFDGARIASAAAAAARRDVARLEREDRERAHRDARRAAERADARRRGADRPVTLGQATRPARGRGPSPGALPGAYGLSPAEHARQIAADLATVRGLLAVARDRLARHYAPAHSSMSDRLTRRERRAIRATMHRLERQEGRLMGGR